jgi:hypothetical protein
LVFVVEESTSGNPAVRQSGNPAIWQFGNESEEIGHFLQLAVS